MDNFDEHKSQTDKKNLKVFRSFIFEAFFVRAPDSMLALVQSCFSYFLRLNEEKLIRDSPKSTLKNK